jgi:hypothetical protein
MEVVGDAAPGDSAAGDRDPDHPRLRLLERDLDLLLTDPQLAPGLPTGGRFYSSATVIPLGRDRVGAGRIEAISFESHNNGETWLIA